MLLVYGTTVALGNKGVLIRGPSGSGKSDLALRLIDGGAVLVADDQTEIAPGDGVPTASPPATIAGLLEVRGMGIVRMAYRIRVPLALVVDLADPADIERLPDPAAARLLDRDIPVLRLAAFESATPAKIRLATALPPGGPSP
jgi:serine kinase of HPr protein (carbohydrate metabolism regulator)